MGELRKLIILPCYNEEESILQTVSEIKNYAPDFDYIVINDASTDATLPRVREEHIPYVALPINLGIGGAVQTGYRYAHRNEYDLAVQVDGDGQHDVRYLADMVRAMEEQHADMVIGSRFIEEGGFRSTRIRRIGIRYFTALIRVLSGQTVTDPTSGLRMVNRDVIDIFKEEYPRDYPEPETLMMLLRKKKKVVEVPVKMRGRQGGISSIRPMVAVYYMVKVTLAILMERMRKD